MKQIFLSLTTLTCLMSSVGLANTQCETKGGEIYQARIDRSIERLCGFDRVLIVGLNDYEQYKQGINRQAITAFLKKDTGCRGLQDISPACASAGAQTKSDSRGDKYCLFKDGSLIDGLTFCMGSKDLNKLPSGSPF